MTPEPKLWVMRSRGASGSPKKRRKKGSCKSGLSATRTRPRLEMFTTAVSTCCIILARLGTASPRLSTIGKAAHRGWLRARLRTKDRNNCVSVRVRMTYDPFLLWGVVCWWVLVVLLFFVGVCLFVCFVVFLFVFC